jgi:CRP/FNR family transcriptional regulator
MLSPIHRDVEELPANHPCSGCPVREIAICGALDSASLRDFRKLGCCIELRPGEELVRQGEAAFSVFTVTSGMLKSCEILPDGRRQVTGFFSPGDFIGAGPDDQFETSVEAVEETRLCAFPLRRFEDFVGDHRPLERELYIASERMLADARRHMVLLGRKNAIERIASFFLALSGRRDEADLIRLPMGRSDIADYLGLTKETVSRVLAQLKSRRFIRLLAIDRIEIVDREGLRKLAAGELIRT